MADQTTIPLVDRLRAQATRHREHAIGLASAALLEEAADQIDRERWSFNLRWAADMRAIKRWQDAHPGNDLMWPDHADLCVWLLGETDGISTAARDVLAERRRQIEVEGWTTEHDDDVNYRGILARAASCYAYEASWCSGRGFSESPEGIDRAPSAFWPWNRESWKPGSVRRMLVKAAALILAEIERIDRAAERETGR